MAHIEPATIADALGRHRPTEEQAAVIAGETEPTLVVAGAGAGKTETMVSRVVWLVANELARPSQILGLTFTRKAAGQLAKRIRERLAMLARSPLVGGHGRGSGLAELIRTTDPQISTYDSYAGSLVASYGLLVPVESEAALLSETAVFQLAHDVVSRWEGPLASELTSATLTERALAMAGQLSEHLVDTDDLRKESGELEDWFEGLPKGPRQRIDRTAEMAKIFERQHLRDELADLVDAIDERLRREGALTFGRQMAIAAELGGRHAAVGEAERAAFRVVLLDEYQDTGYAQRAMLAGLFGRGRGPVPAVTAVGDPMQSIYGWRGASASNLPLFRTDFPRSDGGPAGILELSTSWRNPPEVLTLANRVTRELGGRPGTVDVPVLRPRPGAPGGDVRLALTDTVEEERRWVADTLAEAYRARAAGGEPPTAAILLRQNKSARPFSEALTERGIPNEIVGTGGLLAEPEVRDVVALLTMTARPGDGTAALRLLTGPRFGLDSRDLDTLHSRGRSLSLRREGTADTGVLEDRDSVDAALEALGGPETSDAAGLVDALSDPGPLERYSSEGAARIGALDGALVRLRENVTAPPARLVAAAVGELGLDVETRVRYLTGGGDGGQHLDALRAVAASYAVGVTATLSGFLDYLSIAEEREKGLARGQTVAQPGRVQILTVHAAKGLEWEIVAVPHLSEDVFPGEPKKQSWLTVPEQIPSHLRGDRQSEGNPDGAPVFEPWEFADRKEFQDGADAFGAANARRRSDEDRRLFYVAVTRSEGLLLLSGFHWSHRKKIQGPSVFLREMAELCYPDVSGGGVGRLVEWSQHPPEENPTEEQQLTAVWPGPSLHSGTGDEVRAVAAREVERAASTPERLPANDDGLDSVQRRWISEAGALLAERAAERAGPTRTRLPRRLSASEVVALSKDPDRFHERLRRPVPLRPNRFARKGTRFHAWLENRFGATHLLDLDDLPGAGDDTDTDADLAALQEAFENSRWGPLVPEEVEVPFEVGIGGRRLRGRMDAVYAADDGWIVVDWKTGAVPTRDAMPDVAMQLAIYRYAWRRIVESRTGRTVEPDEVRAVFHYVGRDLTVEPAGLPGPEELARMIDEGDLPLPEDVEDGAGRVVRPSRIDDDG